MIGWWSHFHDLRVASTRLRGELVMRALRARGVAVQWFDPKRQNVLEALVVSKRHDAATLDVALSMQARGTRLIVDLCDNRFHYPSDNVELRQQAEHLKALLMRADGVVVSTHALKAVVQQECPQLRNLSVIGDPADDLSVVPVTLAQRLRAAIGLRRSSSQLRQLQVQEQVRLIWFGNHGGAYAEAGINDLLRIRDSLERCHRHSPLSLTIISNHRGKYLQNIAPFAIPTRYEEWHALTFDRILQLHDVAVIPITDNAFTRCKTDNRVATALLNGVAVIADEIPSYRPYAGAVMLNSWEELPQYLADGARRRAEVTAGQQLARALTDPERIAQQWEQALHAASVQLSHDAAPNRSIMRPL